MTQIRSAKDPCREARTVQFHLHFHGQAGVCALIPFHVKDARRACAPDPRSGQEAMDGDPKELGASGGGGSSRHL